MKKSKEIAKQYHALLEKEHAHIEQRSVHGVFIVRNGHTLYGFNTWKLCVAYLERAVKRGYLYVPTASETYGVPK